MSKMRGTRSMGHGPGKTSMRTGGKRVTVRKGAHQSSTRALNASLNRSIGPAESESAKPGIAKAGN